MRVSDQLRKGLAESGKFQLLDIAPVSAAARGSNLQACGGCDVQLGAEARRRPRRSPVWCRRFRISFSTSTSTCATPAADGSSPR